MQKALEAENYDNSLMNLKFSNVDSNPNPEH